MTDAIKRLRFRWVLLGIAFCLTSCGTMPSGAPRFNDIKREANQADVGFAFFHVTQDFLKTNAAWLVAADPPTASWLPHVPAVEARVIRAQDHLTLRIWDYSSNSLLTEPGKKSAQFQDVVVAADGTASIPYLGAVPLRGLTPELARAKIQTQLETILPAAQVQLLAKTGENSRFDLVQGVQRPGSYPLLLGNITLQSALAVGGGPIPSLRNPYVQVQRGQKTYATSLEKLAQDATLDRYLRPGDKVHVLEDERFFLSFGATGREQLHWFPKPAFTAMEAIAFTGGLQSEQGHPEGLLIFRTYAKPPSQADDAGPSLRRVVFAFDLSRAQGVFAAQEFEMQSKDLLVATQAPIRDLASLTGLLDNVLRIFQRANEI